MSLERTVDSMQPVPDHAAWMPLAEEAYRRIVDDLVALPPDRWGAATPCAGWTVRDLAGHMLGAMRSAASLRETISQQRAFSRRAKATGELEVDAMTAVQIERTAALSVDELVAEMRSLIVPATRGRARMPGFVRRRAGFHADLGVINERWTLDYFLGCILTRDAWLHRIDLADSLGAAPELDEHDATIVGDVAAEWADRHGQPVRLHLTGPAGGTLEVGPAGEDIELDAIQFCRVVSGRATHPHSLLAQPVPF
jgi:uncharacterized protein (TIGR03083 family)